MKILRNADQVWPVEGWAEVLPDYDSSTSYKITNLKVSANDKIRFVVKHNGEIRADRIEWDPQLVIQK